MHGDAPDTSRSPAGLPDRRNFLARAMAAFIGGVVMLIPIGTGVLFFLDPLLRKKRSIGSTGAQVDAKGFVNVAGLAEVPADGTPRAVPVITDQQDFWNKFPNTEIGAVYLCRNDAGEVNCFNARCPHLGCTVNYKADAQAFVCPCHDSSFDLDGKRSNDIPPRDMDSLEVEVRNNNEVWVKFQKFRAGIEEKLPL